MDCAEKQFDMNLEAMPEVSAERCMKDMTAQFSSRGLVKSAEAEAQAQMDREKATCEESPICYRLSSLSEEFITERYRHGKESMDGGDLLEYFGESRALRANEADFSATPPEDELVKCGEAEKPCILPVRGEKKRRLRERASALPARVKALPGETVERVKLSTPLWFNGAKADSSRERRRFPLSAFAAILAIAMSLTLVVASSVLVNHAEGRLNTLKIEVSQVSSEVSDMKSDLSVQHDLLALREIAVNEMGMVDEDFVRTEYVSNHSEDSIVILEEEEEKTVGLSAILNALGIK